MIRSQPLPIKKSGVRADTETSPSRDGLLSKSLGDPSRMAGLATLHRRSSEGAGIRYCGYLMKRSNKPYRQVCEFPVSESPDTEHPAGLAAGLIQHSEAMRDVNTGNGDLPYLIPAPEDLATAANHETLISSQESEELQNSPMDQSLQLVANFFGCENDSSVEEPKTRQKELNSIPGILQHYADIEIENGGSAVVSPDQLVSDQTDQKPSSNSTPLSINGSPVAPYVPTAPPAPPFCRNDSAPAAFSNIDSSSVTTANTDGQAPMVDFIDPLDGHIWRYKYCILEDGVLYFYRNQKDGESLEAQLERDQGSSFDHEETSPSFEGIMDLSKSPMPRAKLLSSLMDKDQREFLGLSGSSRSNVIWEKRVQLDRVGAVRSAELEYGHFSFELLGVDDDGKDDQDGNYDEAGGQDRLILRARNSDEMNDWLFQFHRSLQSIMRHIMEAVESSPSSDRGRCVPLGDIHHPLFAPSPLGSIPAFTETEGSAFSHTLSPAGRYRPAVHFPASLSHGHGRSRMHRRRSPVQQPSDQNNDSLVSSVSPPPIFGAAPPEPFPMFLETSNQPLRRVTPVSAAKISNNSALGSIGSSDGGIGDGGSLDSAILLAIGGTTKRPPHAVATASTEKYVPPHLRNKKKQLIGSSGSRRYIPPQLRKQMEEMDSERRTGEGNFHPEENGEPQGVPEKAREMESREGMKDDHGYEAFELSDDGRLSENGDALTGEQQQPVKLGGCADPMVAVGSILDFPLYKSRKASRVGKVHTDAFGCYGGGPLYGSSQVNSLEHITQNGDNEVLRWEVGAVSECGIRDSNEDSYLIASDLIRAFGASQDVANKDGPDTPVWTQATHQPGLFAIFDGHCENQAARYAAEKAISFILNASTEQLAATPQHVEEIEGILLRAIANLDNAFCRLCTQDGRDWDSGSTALFAVLAHDHLVVANLGDCRGVMCCSVDCSSEESTRRAVLQSEGWEELESDDEDTLIDSKWIRATGDATTISLWKEITDVHSPSRNDEHQRIKEANGWITTETEIPIGQLQRMDFWDEDVVEILKRCFPDRHNCSQEVTPSKKCNSAPQRILHISRVCGELAVSRALGDREFKAAFNESPGPEADKESELENGDAELPPQLPDGIPWDCPLFLLYPDNHSRRFVGDLVSAIPEVQKIKIGQKGFFDEFVVLACDGLWDVMDPDDAVRVARGLLFEKKWSAKKAAARLAEIAIHLGSSDNITVIIIRLFKAT